MHVVGAARQQCERVETVAVVRMQPPQFLVWVATLSSVQELGEHVGEVGSCGQCPVEPALTNADG